jgi:hypothetical protein
MLSLKEDKFLKRNTDVKNCIGEKRYEQIPSDWRKYLCCGSIGSEFDE